MPTAYGRGNVLLTPFPYSDLSASKLRPVVVISTSRYSRVMGEMMVAMLTSMPRKGPYDCEIARWREAGLLAPTWCRAKIATLSTHVSVRRVGSLAAEDLHRVNAVIRKATS